MTYALDTNIIIHLLQNSPPVTISRDAALKQGELLVIPPYVHYEIRRGLLYVSAPVKEKLYHRLCSLCPVGDMTADAWETAAALYADLRRKHYTVGDADILIAAFCIVNDFILVTDNTKDFEHIDRLQMTNWAK